MVTDHGSQESISEFHGLVFPRLPRGSAAPYAYTGNSFQEVKKEVWCGYRGKSKLSASHNVCSNSHLLVFEADRIVDPLYR